MGLLLRLLWHDGRRHLFELVGADHAEFSALLLPVLFLAAALSPFAQAPAETGLSPALSDGSSSVKLIWTPPKEGWPAGGFTLERAGMSGPFAPVAKGLRPDWDPALTASLPGPQRDPIKRLGELDRQAGTGKVSEDFAGLKNFLFLPPTVTFLWPAPWDWPGMTIQE